MLPTSPFFRIPASIWLFLVGISLLIYAGAFLFSAFNFVGVLIWVGLVLFAGAYGLSLLWAFSRLQLTRDRYGAISGIDIKR